ncbi:MAG: DUF2784 domain-containing protein [Deltaproteobacteria bacterium]|nr:DUF2784 domain-containing protein [Deltaproteobacteria bacterium]
MIYSILADVTIFVHFLWILFILSGVIFALRRSKIAWVHLGGLLFSLVLNLFGWYCPLTHLENYLNSLYPGSLTYGGSFIAHYLEQIVYPDLPEIFIRIGGILFVCLNIIVYLVVAKKYWETKRSSG